MYEELLGKWRSQLIYVHPDSHTSDGFVVYIAPPNYMVVSLMPSVT